MASHLESKPKKLSLFALDQETALPITRMPFYAEVGVRSTLEPPPVPFDDRFEDPIGGALNSTDSECMNGHQQCQERVAEVLGEGLSRLLSAEARNRLAADTAATNEFLARVIRRARDARAGATLLGLDIDTLRPLLDKVLILEAEDRGLVLTVAPELTPIAWAHPMGILATDHVGYLSFDLTRLPDAVYRELQKSIAARRLDPEATLDTTIWVYPMTREEHCFDALAQGRFAHDAILLKLQLHKPDLPAIFKNIGALSMQNPDLTDWRLSPGSFASNPAALVGQGGCETLLPANVALQEFHFYQVLRLIDPEANLNDQIKLGVIHEYRLAWYPLGHSLGQILYSLPLAPGESVNLAVIDWLRQDTTQRAEQTKLDEHLIHDQHRDRTITETVRGAVGEFQEGSSFMAGAALSVGASTAAGAAIGSVVPGVGTAIGAGVGLLAGLALSIGGSSSDSSGSRRIASNTVQKLSDNISQASSVMRELQSSVVVHSTQSEKEVIETRTVVNYNHSHTLTVLYYEVLRHFRIVTELAHRRPAVLVKMPVDLFAPANAAKTILENRAVLERVLLDAALAGGFDAVARIARRPAPFVGPIPKPPGPGDREFIYFTFEMTVGGFALDANDKDERLDITAALYGGTPVQLWNRSRDPAKVVLNPRGSFREMGRRNTFVAMLPAGHPPVKWKDIDAISIGVNFYKVDDIAFTYIKVTARDLGGDDQVLVEMDYDLGHLILAHDSDSVVFPTLRAPLPPAPAAKPAEEIEDELKKAELLAHIAEHSVHYTRAILFAQNAYQRAQQLDKMKLPDGSTVLDHIENRPLEIIGDFVAYSCSDTVWASKVFDLVEPAEAPPETPVEERLVTLPTRGVFAEARLGHCNASEEIDNTRFWDWQVSPIPHLAPEIAAVQPISPQPQQQNVSPTPFPASLINIVSPASAPDPTAMAAALNLLGTSNIFRDMSGRAEVAQLLGKLSDNSLTVAQAASEASRIQSKYGNNLQGSGGSGRSGAVGIGGQRAMPNQPSASNRDLYDMQPLLERAQERNLLSPETVQRLYEKAVQEQFTPAQFQNISTGGSQPIDVKLRIFIPSRVVLIALPIAGDVGFEGDNRGFSYDAGTSRAELWVDASYSDQSNPIRIKRREFGESKYYHKQKIVDVLGKPFWWKAVKRLPLLPEVEEAYDGFKIAAVTDESLRVTGRFELPPLGLVPVLRISFLVHGTLPLEPLVAPAIDCELNLDLTQTPGGGVVFSLKGAHDGFPAYELYVNRQRVYSYDPVEAGTSPLALAPPTDVLVDIPPTILTAGPGITI